MAEANIRNDSRYRGGKRYLEIGEFMGYLRLLHVIEQDDRQLMEFLERQRLVVPAARVRYPDDVVRRSLLDVPWERVSRDLPHAPSEETWQAAIDLDEQIDRWRSHHPKAPLQHPCDVRPASHEPFITRMDDDVPFVPWSEHRVLVWPVEGERRFVDRGTTTYYHYWQAFQVAASLDMGVHTLLDLGDEENRRLALAGQLSAVPDERRRGVVIFRGLHVIRGLREHVPALEAVAWYQYYSNRALARAVEGQGSVWVLRGAPLDAFRERERAIAREACARFEMTEDHLLALIKWHCAQWQEEGRRGRGPLVDEHRANLGAACNLMLDAFDRSYEDLESAVGRCIGGGKPALKQVFPDWVEEEREIVSSTFKSIVRAWNGAGADASEQVSEALVGEFLAWLERAGLISLYWGLRASREVGIQLDRLSSAALSGWLLATASIWEHTLTVAIEERGGDGQPVTLKPKLDAIWANEVPVRDALHKNWSLTKTDAVPFDEQLARIVELQGRVPRAVPVLLKATLVRNQSTHRGLHAMDTESLRSLERDVLTAIILSWAQVQKRGDGPRAQA